MLSTFQLYCHDPSYKGHWQLSSSTVASSNGRGKNCARNIRQWCQDFAADHTTLPRSQYGARQTSILHSNEDLKGDIITHLQSIGKSLLAKDLLSFFNSPAILERLGRSEELTLPTAQRWLRVLGYRWKKDAKGMYVDVVKYRQKKFLPQ